MLGVVATHCELVRKTITRPVRGVEQRRSRGAVVAHGAAAIRVKADGVRRGAAWSAGRVPDGQGSALASSGGPPFPRRRSAVP